MSMTDPAARTTTEVRGTTSDSFVEPEADVRETTPSLLTIEFWLLLAGVAALIVVYNTADDTSLNLWRLCLLCTGLGMAYFVSRGLSRSGTGNHTGTRFRIGRR